MTLLVHKVSCPSRISSFSAQCNARVALKSIRIGNVQVAEGVAVPASVALPFGAFERSLKDPVNKAAAASIAALQKELVNSCAPPNKLTQFHRLTFSLEVLAIILQH